FACVLIPPKRATAKSGSSTPCPPAATPVTGALSRCKAIRTGWPHTEQRRSPSAPSPYSVRTCFPLQAGHHPARRPHSAVGTVPVPVLPAHRDHQATSNCEASIHFYQCSRLRKLSENSSKVMQYPSTVYWMKSVQKR